MYVLFRLVFSGRGKSEGWGGGGSIFGSMQGWCVYVGATLTTIVCVGVGDVVLP